MLKNSYILKAEKLNYGWQSISFQILVKSVVVVRCFSKVRVLNVLNCVKERVWDVNSNF